MDTAFATASPSRVISGIPLGRLSRRILETVLDRVQVAIEYEHVYALSIGTKIDHFG